MSSERTIVDVAMDLRANLSVLEGVIAMVADCSHPRAKTIQLDYYQVLHNLQMMQRDFASGKWKLD